MESIGIRAPGVGDVFESHEIGACIDGADRVACVPTRQVRLMRSSKSSTKTNKQNKKHDPFIASSTSPCIMPVALLYLHPCTVRIYIYIFF
jgi:hypothetical protein